MNVRDVLARLPGHKRNGSGWTARCPAHDDRTPSLSIREGDSGAVLLRCHAGCTTDAVCKALGIELRDLMPDAPGFDRPKQPRPRHATHTKGFPTRDEAIRAAAAKVNGKPVAGWLYRTADGADLFWVARFAVADGRKEYRPVWHDAGAKLWRIADPPEPLPLYRLPELLASSGRVYVAEGEKCVEALAQPGLTATTSAHGANAPHKSEWSPLSGRDVVVLPDADEAGRRYAADVARILYGLNPPATVRIVELPGLAEGQDVADYIGRRRAEGADDAAIRAGLEQLADAAPVAPARDVTPPAHDARSGDSDCCHHAAVRRAADPAAMVVARPHSTGQGRAHGGRPRIGQELRDTRRGGPRHNWDTVARPTRRRQTRRLRGDTQCRG